VFSKICLYKKVYLWEKKRTLIPLSKYCYYKIINKTYNSYLTYSFKRKMIDIQTEILFLTAFAPWQKANLKKFSTTQASDLGHRITGTKSWAVMWNCRVSFFAYKKGIKFVCKMLNFSFL
jgi:hypothetical protein